MKRIPDVMIGLGLLTATFMLTVVGMTLRNVVGFLKYN